MIPVIRDNLAALAANPAALVAPQAAPPAGAAPQGAELGMATRLTGIYLQRVAEGLQDAGSQLEARQLITNAVAVHVVMSNIAVVPTMLPAIFLTATALARFESACSSRKEQMQKHHRTAVCKMKDLVACTFAPGEISDLARLLGRGGVPRFLESIPYFEEKYRTPWFFPSPNELALVALVQRWKTFLEDRSVQRQCHALQVMRKRVGEEGNEESFQHLAFRMGAAVFRDPFNPDFAVAQAEQAPARQRFYSVRTVVEFLSSAPEKCSQPAALTRYEPKPALLSGVDSEPTCGDDIAGPASSVAAVALPSATPPGETYIYVTHDVGYGNTLYLRGDPNADVTSETGARLSWDEGLPMTCMDGDLWSLRVFAREPFTYKCFINNDSARGIACNVSETNPYGNSRHTP